MGGTHDGGLYDAILAEQAKGNAFKVSHNKEIQRANQPAYVHTRVHKKWSCHQPWHLDMTAMLYLSLFANSN